MSPKVFVSHASEDKDRFVLKFATKLRKNGVDAWLDKWEMLVGDSLVDKIFEEGLKESTAVIIILSNYSINKPWVREELNASIVYKISKGTKIIPIILDDCQVPESLASTLWESITDLDSYEDSFKKILNSIFGVIDKPSLGNPPSHYDFKYQEIGGLSKLDNLILKESCEYLIINNNGLINPNVVFGDGSKIGLNHREVLDSIEVLENNSYLEVTRYFGGSDKYSCYYSVTVNGFENYVRAYIENYSDILKKVISSVVNKKIKINSDIAEFISESIVIVDHILDSLELNGHIKLSKSANGMISVFHISATLPRFLVSQSGVL